MTRKDFIKTCGVLGLALPLQTTLSSCNDENIDFQGKVIIIGAGAGGLSAGYLLQQKGIEFEILEASARYGGRMRIDTDFADFPIPLGAEWLETETGIFQEIVNDATTQVNIETVPDDPDQKFVNYSWFNFFEDYILPPIANKIAYNTIVQSVDYSGNQIVVKTQNGEHTADRVIISVPLQVLRDEDISFTPPLPQDKRDAIDEPVIWEGFKAFFEFDENFYDDGFEVEIDPQSDGQKIYYNAAHGQNTSRNILGLFTVGKPAREYLSLSEDELKASILNELDIRYANQASPNYVKHISQNWNKEPFIKAGYMADDADWKTVQKLGESVANKLYFAGGAYTDGNDWVSVHTAAQSAKKAVDEII
ncbi:MAG: flavin monoamine oxidase family protein [Bacteroidia bacterium]